MASYRENKIVFFLGAGVSKCLHIPLMNDFTYAVRDSGCLAPNELFDFERILDECDKLSMMIGGSARNLENLASFLETLRFARPTTEFRCTTFNTPDLASGLITRCLATLTNPVVSVPPLQKMCDLLQSPLSDLSIITTNYDLHVECAAKLGNVKLRVPTRIMDGLSGVDRKGNSIYDSSSGVALYKLHGSVNWFVSRDRVEVDDRIVPHYGRNRSWPESYSLGSRRLRTGRLCDRVPLIVPPSMLKASAIPAISEQWQGAARVINEAERLVFIGYSFPSSDSFMQYFLASALFGNTKLRQLAIVDPSPSVSERARALFATPSHRAVMEAHEYGWENLDPHSLLNGQMNRPAEHFQLGQLHKLLGQYLTRELRNRH